MPDAVSGGNGLFLMTEHDEHRSGTPPRGADPARCGASYGSPSGSTTENHNIEPLHNVCRLI
jgi:hypothetical protein